MANLALISTVVGIGAQVVGTAMSMSASIDAGRREQESQYAQAHLEEGRGRAEFAQSQREAQNRRLEGELVMSRQQAAAAASGGGAGSDAPTIVRLMTETGARAKLGAETARHAGETTREAYFQSAKARRKTGNSSFLGGVQTAAGTFASGIGKIGGQVYSNRSTISRGFA